MGSTFSKNGNAFLSVISLCKIALYRLIGLFAFAAFINLESSVSAPEASSTKSSRAALRFLPNDNFPFCRPGRVTALPTMRSRPFFPAERKF